MQYKVSEDCFTCKIPDDAVAIKRINYKFRLSGDGVVYQMLFKSPTNWWKSEFTYYLQQETYNEAFLDASSGQQEQQSDYLNTMGPGDEIVAQVLSYRGEVSYCDN